jgi:DNA transformation protein
MAYWTAPVDALDDDDRLVPWARRSLEVAARKKR